MTEVDPVAKPIRVYPSEEKAVPKDYKEFYRLYHPFVSERVRRYNRGQVTPDQMADVEHAIWVRFIEYDVLSKYSPTRGSFPGFLGSIIYNASWNLRRARKKSDCEKPLKSGTEEYPDDPRLVFEEVLCNDNGKSASDSFQTAELRILDSRLSRFFSDVERDMIYQRVMSGSDLEDVLLSSGLDCHQISFIFDEVLDQEVR